MNVPFWHHELEPINPVSSYSKQRMFLSQMNWCIVAFFFLCKGFIKGNFVVRAPQNKEALCYAYSFVLKTLCIKTQRLSGFCSLYPGEAKVAVKGPVVFNQPSRDESSGSVWAKHTQTHSQFPIGLHCVGELSVHTVLLLAGRSCHFLQVYVWPSCNQLWSLSHSEGIKERIRISAELHYYGDIYQLVLFKQCLLEFFKEPKGIKCLRAIREQLQ